MRDSPVHSAERWATGCLCAAIVAGPVALGGTPHWARLGLEAATATAILLWLVSGRRPLWLTALPLGIAAVACLQIVPLPIGLLRWISPLSASAWQTVATEGWGTVSVDPGSTATAIRRLLLGLATVAAVADLARQPSLRRWLMTAMATSAAVIWGLGLAFPVDPDQRILVGAVCLKGPIVFWKTEIEEPVQTAGTAQYDTVQVGDATYQMPAWTIGDGFGSYVISNHFAGAIGLTLPIALALWLFATRGQLTDTIRYGGVAAAIAAAVWTTGWLADSREIGRAHV